MPQILHRWRLLQRVSKYYAIRSSMGAVRIASRHSHSYKIAQTIPLCILSSFFNYDFSKVVTCWDKVNKVWDIHLCFTFYLQYCSHLSQYWVHEALNKQLLFRVCNMVKNNRVQSNRSPIRDQRRTALSVEDIGY